MAADEFSPKTEASSPWVEGLTIGQVLREAAGQYPQNDALVYPKLNWRMSYAELDAKVDGLARSLLALGIQKGQHLAVWATNCPEWVLLQLASARIGAVLVTINPAYRSTELAYVLKQSDTHTLFLIESFRSTNYFATLEEVVPELKAAEPLANKDFPHLKHVVAINGKPSPGMMPWKELLRKGDRIDPVQLQERETGLQPTDAINIQYTSGTTGFPKGATLTHRNLLLNAFYVGDCQKITSQDRICIPVPFYHCFGCVLGVLCATVRGAAMVIPAEYFDAEATLEAIQSERATAIYGVPTMFIAMLDDQSFSTRNLTSLRTGIMAGSPCPIEIMRRVVDGMGAREITIAYGLTEASPVITQTRTDDPLELRVQTVGRPLPDLEVKLVDPAHGNQLEDGQQGELCVRGHAVMLGYYNMPEQTAQTIDDQGWLHTGDIAVRQPNGYYRITGRIKDMICRGGENIYPREIEEFLYTHPDVQDVAVVGVPDLKLVEAVVAWIRLQDGATCTADELRNFCKEKLAHFKVPRHIRLVSEFPQTVTGKIQKYKIREAMIKELDLEETDTA